MPYLHDCKSFGSLKGSKLIIPAISIGNIPQLTIDLLIHTYELERFAVLSEMFLHPFSSPIDTSTGQDDKGIANPLEIYYSAKHNLTVIQQRSPIIKGFTDLFIKEDLLRFTLAIEPEKVILLDSSDAGLLENYDSMIEIFTNEDLLNKSLESLKISSKTQPLSSEIPYKYSKYILKLIKALETSKIDLTIYVSHVYEGDNFNDAELMAAEVLPTILENVPTDLKWIKPISWLGAYGDKPVPNAMEQGLFG